MDIRIIKTGLYSQEAADILDSVLGQCSDGAYENSSYYERFWKFATVKRTTDGEATIEIPKDAGKSEWGGPNRMTHRYTPNGFYEMSDAQVLEWFAKLARRIARMDLKDHDARPQDWNPTNATFRVCYLDRKLPITIQDVYLAYEKLRGHSLDKFDQQAVKRIVGEKADSAQVAKEEARRKAIADLLDARAKEFQDIELRKKAALEAANKAYTEARQEIFARYQPQIAQYEMA